MHILKGLHPKRKLRTEHRACARLRPNRKPRNERAGTLGFVSFLRQIALEHAVGLVGSAADTLDGAGDHLVLFKGPAELRALVA